MLVINIPEGDELYDETTGEFLPGSSVPVRLEHSLFTISKWEEKWHVPFLTNKPKTDEQTLDYIRCMAIDGIDDRLLANLSEANVKAIDDYIGDPATATTVNEHQKQKHSSQIMTSEVLYIQMFSRQIPIECEHWHINRLLMMLRAWDALNSPQKKMSKKQTAAWYKEQNARNRAKYHTKG